MRFSFEEGKERNETKERRVVLNLVGKAIHTREKEGEKAKLLLPFMHGDKNLQRIQSVHQRDGRDFDEVKGATTACQAAQLPLWIGVL